MKNWVFLILMAAGMALPACSMVSDSGSSAGAPHGSITDTGAAAQNTATVNKGTPVKVKIATPWAAPAAKPGAGSGNGEYDKVLAASQSFTVTVTGAGIATTITGSANVSGSTATVSLAVPVGLSRTFTVKAWGAVNGAGNEISKGSVTSDVIPGVNTIAVTLGAIPATISGAPATATQVGAGTQPTVQLTAKDADGNAILNGTPASVSWSVTTSPTYGTITSSGLYTSPVSVPTSPTTTVTVNVASLVDATVPAVSTTFNLTDIATVNLPFKIWQVSTLAGSAGVSGSTDSGWDSVMMQAIPARFSGPEGITTDGVNLYMTDYWNHTIRKVDLAASTVTTIAGSAGLSGSTDGTGSAARFMYPRGIATDGWNLYVADSGNDTIRKVVIATGFVTTLAGSAGLTGSTDGSFATSRFNMPRGITLCTIWDTANFMYTTYLYVADSGNQTIRQMDTYNGTVTTLAGSAGLTGSTDGAGTVARFSSPWGVTTDGINLYVTDAGSHAIRKVDISMFPGTVTTVAGSAGVIGSTDGTGTAAQFYGPHGITMDATKLYVVDYNNNAIRQVAIATGEVATIAGSAGVTGSADGAGPTARFSSPAGITIVGANLYVSDHWNHTIRKIQ